MIFQFAPKWTKFPRVSHGCGDNDTCIIPLHVYNFPLDIHVKYCTRIVSLHCHTPHLISPYVATAHLLNHPCMAR